MQTPLYLALSFIHQTLQTLAFYFWLPFSFWLHEKSTHQKQIYMTSFATWSQVYFLGSFPNYHKKKLEKPDNFSDELFII